VANEILNLDGTAQAELVRKGAISPLELIDSAIARIEKLNPQLNAVITPSFEKARALAKSGAIPDGPFRGVPFLLKDLICASAGDPLYMGTRLLRDARFVALHDTHLAAKFRAAGFLFLGKTNTPELGLQPTTEPEAFGPSRNPWDTTRSTGGSSGGSAAAVASRMVAVAHANDGGGSIRIPASECGLVGLKPSRGRVSLGPDAAEFWHGFAIEHVVTRSVRDSAAVLDAIAGNMPGDPYAAPFQRSPFTQEVGADSGRLRVGFMKQAPQGVSRIHPDCAAAVEDAAKLIHSLGHMVEESHPAALAEIQAAAGFFFEATSAHTALLVDQIGALAGCTPTAEDFEPYTWGSVALGRDVSASRYLAAIQWLQVWARRLATWWSDGFDLLLTPTIALPPPPLGWLVATQGNVEEVQQREVELIPFTPPFNVTGQPAISLPLYWNSGGLPIGIQLVAAFGREDLLFRVAAQLEQARPWNDRLPPVC
jgi:amidase